MTLRLRNRILIVLALLPGLGAGLRAARAAGAKPGVPVVTVPLEPLGFSGVTSRAYSPRAIMYSVHFVDATHVLFTWNAKGLISRSSADATPDEDNRDVAAVLMELPSGKVLAKTRWHTHDRAQYLWPLGDGRFLLRIRTKLSLLDPVRRLAEGDAFREQQLVDPKRAYGYLSVSPDGSVIAIETVPKRNLSRDLVINTKARTAGDTSVPDDEALLDAQVPVHIHFYRLLHEVGKKGGDDLFAQSAGTVYAQDLAVLALTAQGYLALAKEKTTAYDFDFYTHAGVKTELSVFDTSCVPRPYFVSNTEFIALGCAGGGDRRQLAGFNLMGEEPWLGTYRESFVAPSLALAPSAGRFALSRTLLASSLVDPDAVTLDSFSGQEIAVLQSHDGRTLLKLQTTPIQMNGQNFDLSADGLLLAVVRGTNLEIYALPALNGKDQTEVKRAQAATPPKSEGQILLGSERLAHKKEAQAVGAKKGAEVLVPSSDTPANKDAAASSPVRSPAGGSAAAQASQTSEATTTVGDESVDHRKAPSLFDPEHPKPPQ